MAQVKIGIGIEIGIGIGIGIVLQRWEKITAPFWLFDAVLLRSWSVVRKNVRKNARDNCFQWAEHLAPRRFSLWHMLLRGWSEV